MLNALARKEAPVVMTENEHAPARDQAGEPDGGPHSAPIGRGRI